MFTTLSIFLNKRKRPWSTKNFKKIKQLKIGPNILIKKISFDLNDFDNNDLIINFSNKLLAGKRQNSLEPDPGPLLFEIETRNKKISKQLNNISLDIYFDRSDDFKNFEILDNVENCYLLVKND